MKEILVFREFDNFSRILVENGFKVNNLPLIETKELDNLQDFEKHAKTIEKYDGIFLTSRYAAKVLADRFSALNIEFRDKIYVLGRRSFDILKDRNLDLIFDQKVNTAEEMLKNIPLDDLQNKKFLFVRGEKSLRFVPDFLSNCSEVDETIVYRTVKVGLEIDKIKVVIDKLSKKDISCACFFSPSAVESFLEQFEAKLLHQTFIVVIGKTTAKYLVQKNLRADFISSKANAEAFAFELSSFLRENE